MRGLTRIEEMMTALLAVTCVHRRVSRRSIGEKKREASWVQEVSHLVQLNHGILPVSR
jgi:hypothetical protein